MSMLPDVIDRLLPAISGLSIGEIEAACLAEKQVSCDVTHKFFPGLVIREVTIPGNNTFAVGHHQNFEHTNVLLKGRVSVINENGSVSELVAPLMFVGKPGRKVGIIHEEMVWLNIYPTDLKTVKEVEDYFITKSDDWQADSRTRFALEHINRQADRDDYCSFLAEIGLTENDVRGQVENLADQVTAQHVKTKISESPIHGLGMFATATIAADEVIGKARIGDQRTPFGRWVNHSKSPNAHMVKNGSNIDLVSARQIGGCTGGQDGEEITVDYRRSLEVAKLCQL